MRCVTVAAVCGSLFISEAKSSCYVLSMNNERVERVRWEYRKEVEEVSKKVDKLVLAVNNGTLNFTRAKKYSHKIHQLIDLAQNDYEDGLSRDVRGKLYETMTCLRMSLVDTSRSKLLAEEFVVDEDVFGPVEPNPAWAHVKVILPKAEEA